MGLILTMLIAVVLSIISAVIAMLVLYRYNLMGIGVDYSKDPEWLRKIRKESKWEKV